jgi:pheromone shutdown protein TraB
MDLNYVPPPGQPQISITQEMLPQTVKLLKSPVTGATVYVVGTAHVSEISAREVRTIMQLVKPDTVVLELCRSRLGILLQSDTAPSPSTAPPPPPNSAAKPASVREQVRQQGTSGLLHYLLTKLYSGVLAQLNIVPGIEFRAAFEEAQRLQPPAHIVLGDRPIDVTIKRTWGGLSAWHKVKLIYLLMTELKDNKLNVTQEQIESMKNKDEMTEAIAELSKHFPAFKRHLLDERDLYLCHALRSVRGQVVVGVVGLGHVAGIVEHWHDAQIDIPTLMHVPPSHLKRNIKIFVVSLLVLVVALVVSRFL